MRIDLGEDEQPEIGLVALIDCIFFLLMFFMVATSFKQQDQQRKDKQLAITLPVATAALERAEAAPEPLVIGVDKAGNFYVGTRAVSVEELHARLRQEAEANPHRQVRIDGDTQAAYQHIVHALDLCQFVGLTNIAMHTRN